MRKTILVMAALLILTGSYASTTVIEPKLNASEILFPVGNTGKQISLMELSQIKVKDFEQLTGNKLHFFDRLGFKAAQKKLRNSISSDGTIQNKKLENFFKAEGDRGFHAGGFFLGFFLGLIGVLICYLVNDDNKQNRVRWAWKGFLSALLISLAIIKASGGF